MFRRGQILVPKLGGNLVLNPNGESSCDASLAANDKRHCAGGLLARLLSANPPDAGPLTGV